MNTHRALLALALMIWFELFSPRAQSAGAVQRAVFANGDVKLSGAIHLPAELPTAGIVLIHGSRPPDSFRMTALAALLAREGFAVLTYDKRGIGESGGEFPDGDGGGDFSALAEDAAAAFKTLTRHPQVKGVPLGLLGISQGGWVGPIAASRLSDVAFMVLWSGPVCTVSEEMHFSAMAKQIPDFSMATHRIQVQERMKSAPVQQSDFDPRQVLSQLSFPVLWIFGGRDNSIPVELSIARLQEMIDQGRRNFEFKLFPEQRHGLDYPTPYPNGYDDMVTWIENVARQAQQTAARDRAKSAAREQ